MNFWMRKISQKSKLRELRNRESGKDCFIIGNAPSVRQHDLSALRGKLSIGVNASTALEEEFGFHSRYYVVSDARFLKNPEKRAFACEKVKPGTIRILREELSAVDDPAWIDNTWYVHALGKNGFSFDLASGYYFGCTTVMLALQLAAYLDCSRIFLLGTDLNYAPAQPRFYQEQQVEPPDPFVSVQLWNIYNASLELQKRQKQLFICSRSSWLLPYLEYCDFDAAVAGTGQQPAATHVLGHSAELT